ncbi:hypothetical protein COB21_04650 [Candidatus Aerophobetes bacterium]|uniref:DUF1579 domain-containing protein n=1 Tax=Aerophobetes bacterium TaxID=2030807 RepID=A0A2A4X0R7_UNCAE|nr:MAG: hypothetical protein COB21_04650 [Candidatus Aerophobetes bacterium]
MNDNYHFLTSPGKWTGEGKITLTLLDNESFTYVTKWDIGKATKKGVLKAVQEIQINGMSDIMHNHFIITDMKEKGFNIELTNQAIGKVVGSGLVSMDRLAWEFRLGELGFEGFESYEAGKEGGYSVHAEYATVDDFRTVIHGKMWKTGD